MQGPEEDHVPVCRQAPHEDWQLPSQGQFEQNVVTPGISDLSKALVSRRRGPPEDSRSRPPSCFGGMPPCRSQFPVDCRRRRRTDRPRGGFARAKSACNRSLAQRPRPWLMLRGLPLAEHQIDVAARPRLPSSSSQPGRSMKLCRSAPFRMPSHRHGLSRSLRRWSVVQLRNRPAFPDVAGASLR